MKDHNRPVVDRETAECPLQLVAVGNASRRILSRPIGLDQAQPGLPVAGPTSFRVAGADEELIRPRLKSGRVAQLGEALPDRQQGLLRGVLEGDLFAPLPEEELAAWES